QTIILQNDMYLLGRNIVSVKTDRVIAVRKEIDGIVYPHGIEVVGIVARNFLDRRIFEISNPDRSGLASAITLPCRLPLSVGNVGEMRAVGRKRAILSNGQRQLGGKAAIHSDGVELIVVLIVDAAIRRKYDFRAIWRPSHDPVRAGMVG